MDLELGCIHCLLGVLHEILEVIKGVLLREEGNQKLIELDVGRD